jgi:hypothetical protein
MSKMQQQSSEICKCKQSTTKEQVESMVVSELDKLMMALLRELQRTYDNNKNDTIFNAYWNLRNKINESYDLGP